MLKRAAFATVALVTLCGAVPAAAQSGFIRNWEIPGFDFSPDGVWRVKAQRIAQARMHLLSQGGPRMLSAAMAGPARSQLVLSDTQIVPAVVFRFKNSDTTTYTFSHDTSQYSAALFSQTPPGGLPYTVRTFYEQLSNGNFSMNGKVLGFVNLDSNEVTYTGAPGSCTGSPFGGTECNGLFSVNAVARMQRGLREALTKLNSGGVDWGQFDNDGPDGIPNSGDDDGYVDMVMFVQPAKDGACGPGNTNNHLWSHRFVLVDSTESFYQDFVTSTAWTGHPGQFIKIRNYFLTSGVGGLTACDSTHIMPIGTAAHEFGHGLGLPDLYDTQGTSEGIGEWGLMGSGNYTAAYSPSRYEAWSLSQFGWVTLAPITTNGTYSFDAAPLSDTAFYVRPTGSNPRGEYFLLENRQAQQADTALIRIHGGGGLLVWHVDSEQVVNHGFLQDNTVNFGSIHGLRLEEADGLGQLLSGANRGDAGDPYPGTSSNTLFSFNTNPAAVKNSDGSFVGFVLDSIRQVSANHVMSFRLRFGGMTLIHASDTLAQDSVDGTAYRNYVNVLDSGSTHTVAVADTQFDGTNRRRWIFASWSDSGARHHTISGTLAGDTLIVTLNRAFKVNVTTTTGGHVTYGPVADSSGAFAPEGVPDTLTAVPDSGYNFGGWTGDTTTGNTTLVLPLHRPYNVTASFTTGLVISSGSTRPDGVMGAAYNDTLHAAGGTGSFTWAITAGALPTGVSLSSGGVLSGYPHNTGGFSYTARATSGIQQVTKSFSFNVSAPTLVTATVVNQILAGSGALTADQLRYLDYLGNNNGSFDVGDFLAWVQATGAPLTAPKPIAVRKKGGRP